MRWILVLGCVLLLALAFPSAEAKKEAKHEGSKAEKSGLGRAREPGAELPRPLAAVPILPEDAMTPRPLAPEEPVAVAPLAVAEPPGESPRRATPPPHAVAGASTSFVLSKAPFWVQHAPLASLALLGLVVSRVRRGPEQPTAAVGPQQTLQRNIDAVQANPFDACARLELGVALLRGGDAERAMPQLARAFTLDPATIVLLLEDPDFAPLRESPEIRELLEMVRREQARRVDPAYG